jgi:hypothetical protein
MRTIASIAPTICTAMGAENPRSSTENALDEIVFEAAEALRGELVDRCLIYAPDAIGEVLYEDHIQEFAGVERLAPTSLLLRSMLPPKTPVCFASMFTGALPEVHGIRRYEKPVLECDTLFDSLVRSGKRAAIASVEGSSIAKIFLEREIDYFIEADDGKVNVRAKETIEKGAHDLVLVYNQDYDDAIHGGPPRSPEALTAFKRHLVDFEELSRAFLERNSGLNRLIVFSPDHGVHLDEETGNGDHGLDIPEDMEVRSFWGFYKRGSGPP